jgi:hypothetical protein
LDYCFIDRFESEVKNSNIFYNILLFLLIINIIFSLLMIKSNVLNLLYKLIYIIGWYYCSNSLLNYLKIYYEDKNCNVHFNSISGHSNLIIFSLLSIMYLRIENYEENNFYIFFHLLYFVFSLIVITQTYIFGYHSLR